MIDNSACCSVWNRYFNNIFAVRGGGGGIRHRVSKDIEVNNNLYFISSGIIGNYGNVNYTNLATWSAALGTFAKNGNNDSKSIVADPKFVANFVSALQTTSPAIGASLAVPATWTIGFEVKTDRRGWGRGTKKDIGAFEVAGHRSYGASCQGLGGKAPVLNFTGKLGPGDSVGLVLTNARASSPVFVIIGAASVSVNLGGSCVLLAQPLIVLGASTTPSGNLSFGAKLSINQKLNGFSTFCQMGVVDAAAVGGIATTNGIELKL